ncbi:unnamed protein product [Mytilus edulis]|uniref:PHD-type domain-containing protein n=1 Tax=Mytilus edulis TaxID=6550 RepID=A0A8S3Q204_MYTED|nr:unnamed protein product [Mytilus edulis]
MSRKLEKYIENQPQYPDGFQYKTPILVSDSKGFTLRNACKEKEFPLESWSKSGATTEVLVDLIKSRIEKSIKRHQHVIIYLWSGTCDLTKKEGRFIKLKSHSKQSIQTIEEQYNRAINIVSKYQNAEIKFIDCPLLSISNWNKYKGHKNPETYKVEDFLVTKQIQELNYKIYQLNSKLTKTSVKNALVTQLQQQHKLTIGIKNAKKHIQLTRSKYSIARDRSSDRLLLLLLSGIETNPGPRRPRFPCTICQKACKLESIACDDCDKWTHRNCIGMSTTEFSNLGKSEDTWTCPSCSKPNNSSTKVYFIPSGDDSKHSSLNISTNPLLLDSISDSSIPSTS